MGLAVGAACIALAVFLPGIGTVAAGALLGAGMGAISASVAGAVSDYSSGNVRSLGEATKDSLWLPDISDRTSFSGLFRHSRNIFCRRVQMC